MDDLFSLPNNQLYRTGQTTSRAALDGAEKSRDSRQRRVFTRLKEYPHGTIPERLAAVMGEDLIDMRRCFSVLKKLGKIEETGEEIQNDKGRFCQVWKVKNE